MADNENEAPSAQAMGGLARAKSLSPAERQSIASAGAAARWGKTAHEGDDIPKAVAEGELTIGELVIPCAVLEDGTRLISERGLARAFGRTRGGEDGKAAARFGGELPFFLAKTGLRPFLNKDLALVEYRRVLYTPRRASRIAYGTKAELLPNICEIWLQARAAGLLTKWQIPTAEKAEIIMRGLARIGITALVDEATGYQYVRDRDELQRILSAYISAEFLPWSQRFPFDYYKEMFRLWDWPWPPSDHAKGGPLGPRYAGKLTNKLIYDHLPPGVSEALREKSPADEKWQRRDRLHQHLTPEIGQPHLEKQVAVVTGIMKVCDDKDEFMRKFEKAYPGTFSGTRQGSFIRVLEDPKSDNILDAKHLG